MALVRRPRPAFPSRRAARGAPPPAAHPRRAGTRAQTVQSRNCSKPERNAIFAAMIEVSLQGRVAVPPEVVWPLVSDPARLPEWFAFAERIEVLDGEGVGQRRRQHG